MNEILEPFFTYIYIRLTSVVIYNSSDPCTRYKGKHVYVNAISLFTAFRTRVSLYLAKMRSWINVMIPCARACRLNI